MPNASQSCQKISS
ncbi:hypothetical protein CIB84_016694 [Bambusicola thoracicus]|uniref:Uncharacterized protein n=1 Tax=Bambusicola thoracicus TaxID=9083 RepID=A0A2P4S612_BAMTH|nr:hypothetical protein CIB84_016694 [Bambusicola thoracicus]